LGAALSLFRGAEVAQARRLRIARTRQAWLKLNHDNYTATEAADHWDCSEATIRKDATAIGVHCKIKAQVRKVKPTDCMSRGLAMMRT
jgi:hypothetical protein